MSWSDVAWTAIVSAGLAVEAYGLAVGREHTLSYKIEALRDRLPRTAQWIYRLVLLGGAGWLVVHWAW